jgi:hypothetical protein
MLGAMRWSTRVVVALGVTSVVMLSCTARPSPSRSGQASSPTSPAAGSVTELTAIEDLSAAFNADRGVARLILLLSPT